jgi:hypothetical protein
VDTRAIFDWCIYLSSLVLLPKCSEDGGSAHVVMMVAMKWRFDSILKEFYNSLFEPRFRACPSSLGCRDREQL